MKQSWQLNLRQYALVFALYLGVALLITWPVLQTAGTHFIGSETGDTYEMARNVWWLAHALQTGVDPYFHTLLGYPDGFSGLVLTTVPMQYYPMAALSFVLPLPLAFNLMVWVFMALNGWTMYWLMRDWLADDAQIPAFLAGLIFMAFPILQSHMGEGHAGLLVMWPVSLFLWAVFRLMNAETQVWRWLLASALFFYLSTTGHILQAIYVLLPLTGVIGLARLLQRDWRAVRRLVAMGVVAVGLMIPILYPALSESFAESAYIDTTGFSRYSADTLAIVSPSFLNPTIDAVLDYPRRVLGINLVEGSAYIGIIGFVLSLIAIFKVREARLWLVLALVTWIASLGPVLKIFDQPALLGGQTIPLPFALLQDLPGFNLARTPGRFTFTLAVAVAILAGYGMNWVWQRRSTHPKWQYGVVVLLSGFILWEYQVFWPVPTLPAAVPQAVHDLREDEVEAIFNIPHRHLLAAKDGAYLQTVHQQPLIAGQITRTTPVDPGKLAVLEGTLHPVLLNEVGADIVILHKVRAAEIGQLEILSARAMAQLGEPYFEDERLALYRVPDVLETSIYFAEYQSGESVVKWLTGGIGLWGYGRFSEDGYGVTLHWVFENALQPNDIRFVHVVDEAGNLVWQNDQPLLEALTQGYHGEFVPIEADLPAGNYTIRVGWYRLEGDSVQPYFGEDGAGHIDVGELVVE